MFCFTFSARHLENSERGTEELARIEGDIRGAWRSLAIWNIRFLRGFVKKLASITFATVSSGDCDG